MSQNMAIWPRVGIRTRNSHMGAARIIPKFYIQRPNHAIHGKAGYKSNLYDILLFQSLSHIFSLSEHIEKGHVYLLVGISGFEDIWGILYLNGQDYLACSYILHEILLEAVSVSDCKLPVDIFSTGVVVLFFKYACLPEWVIPMILWKPLR